MGQSYEEVLAGT